MNGRGEAETSHYSDILMKNEKIRGTKQRGNEGSKR